MMIKHDIEQKKKWYLCLVFCLRFIGGISDTSFTDVRLPAVLLM
jgi:hypothetical protein